MPVNHETAIILTAYKSSQIQDCFFSVLILFPERFLLVGNTAGASQKISHAAVGVLRKQMA